MGTAQITLRRVDGFPLDVSADPAQFIGSGTCDVRMLSAAHETCCQSTVVEVTAL